MGAAGSAVAGDRDVVCCFLGATHLGLRPDGEPSEGVSVTWGATPKSPARARARRSPRMKELAGCSRNSSSGAGTRPRRPRPPAAPGHRQAHSTGSRRSSRPRWLGCRPCAGSSEHRSGSAPCSSAAAPRSAHPPKRSLAARDSDFAQQSPKAVVRPHPAGGWRVHHRGTGEPAPAQRAVAFRSGRPM